MKKILLLLTITLLSLTSFSQIKKTKQYRDPIVSILYSGNIDSMPTGFGLFFHTKYLSIFSTFKNKMYFYGNNQPCEDNSGIYQIGTWGNIRTGRTDSL